MNAAVFKRRMGPPEIMLADSSTWIKSLDLINEKARPNGFTQNVSG